MNDDRFWQLISDMRSASNGICVDHVSLLTNELAKYSEAEISSFDYLIGYYLKLAYTRNLWMAADIINGGCSDDAFTDFRSWLIAQGRNVYFDALQNPETLVRVNINPGQEAFCEAFAYVASRAYRLKTGRELESRLPELTIEEFESEWDEDEMALRFPVLYSKFVDSE